MVPSLVSVRITIVAAAAAVLAAAVTGCGASNEQTRAEPQRSFADPGIEHVHGLGVDPADGTLYAATHFGVFALPESGRATRIADRYQDTMGFTIAGPRTFLGSGHPDFAKDPQLPPLLGLIRSTDAGQSWQTVSLTGEVDFHALRVAHGSIYGWDATSSRFMVSTDDGTTWQRRSTVELRDFAVSPADPDTVIASSARAVLRSADGGKTFTAVRAPALVVVTWAKPESLFGIDTAGVVHRSADGGVSWQRQGSVAGQPEAMTAHADRLYAAVAETGIKVSADGGMSWTVRYSQ